MADEIDKHPALKNFNEPLEMAKHVGGTALRWAAYGAMAAGALMLPIAGIGAIVGGLGTLFSSTAAATGAAGGIMAVLSNPLIIGAGVGAIGGLIKSVPTMEEAIAEKKMNMIADWDMAHMSAYKRQQMAAMAQQQNMQPQNVGVAPSPNIGFGMGKANQPNQMVS